MFVSVELSASLPESEFNAWYNEHIPLRAALPFFHSATRLIASDGEKPTWATAYDLESLSLLASEELSHLDLTRSDYEKDVISRFQFLERRMYEPLESAPRTVSPGHTSKALNPGQLVVLESFDVPSDKEGDLHKWYDTEHIKMLSKVPGWLRSRRFVLREAGANVDNESYQKPPKYLAVHEFDNPDATSTEEWKAAASTPWSNKVGEGAQRSERRTLKVYKTF